MKAARVIFGSTSCRGLTGSVGVVSGVLPVHLILRTLTVFIRMNLSEVLEGDGDWRQRGEHEPRGPGTVDCWYEGDRTFTATIEFLLLPAELVIKLPVKLHLQHLGEHQVAARVAAFVCQQQLGCWTERTKPADGSVSPLIKSYTCVYTQEQLNLGGSMDVDTRQVVFLNC